VVKIAYCFHLRYNRGMLSHVVYQGVVRSSVARRPTSGVIKQLPTDNLTPSLETRRNGCFENSFRSSEFVQRPFALLTFPSTSAISIASSLFRLSNHSFYPRIPVSIHTERPSSPLHLSRCPRESGRPKPQRSPNLRVSSTFWPFRPRFES
jgi:hypothetical protein